MDNPLNKIKKLITGDNSQNIEYDGIFDKKIAGKQNNYLNYSSEPTDITIIKDYISNLKAGDNLSDTTENNMIDDILKEIGVTSFSNEMSIVYDNYEQIVDKIPYASRALNVLQNNILNPDQFNDKDFIIDYDRSNENYKKENIKLIISEMEEYIKHYNLTSLQKKDIIKNTLEYGIYFIEFVDSYIDLKNKKLLLEHIEKSDIKYSSIFSEEKIYLNEDYQIINEDDYNKKTNNKVINCEFSNFIDDISRNKILNSIQNKNNAILEMDEQDIQSKEQKSNDKLNKIYIKYHNPKNIIKLQKDNGSIYGYIEILATSQNQLNGEMPMYVNNQYNQTLRSTAPTSQQKNNVINNILLKLQDKVRQNFNSQTSDIQKNPNAAQILSKLLDNPDYDKVSFKFIPVSHMQEFRLGNELYGQSLFHNSIFFQKIIILLQTAHTISRINDSVEKETVYFDVGVTRDAKKIMNNIKEARTKQKYSIGEMGSINEIPTQISSFQTTYIPQKDGKQFVRIENGNVSSKAGQYVEDLKYFRDQFVQGFNIPPAFLGIEENLSSWNESLSDQNILFVRDVIDYQSVFQDQFTEMFKKLYQLLNSQNTTNNIINYIEIKFNPPTQIKQRLQSDNLNLAIQLVDQLTQHFGKDTQEFFDKKYLSQHVDIDELNDWRLKNKPSYLQKNQEPEQQGGSFNGY